MFDSGYIAPVLRRLTDAGKDVEGIKGRIRSFQIVQATWGYMNACTRFHFFESPGAARNSFEAMDDAAFVQSLCGVCGSIGMETHPEELSSGEIERLAEYGRERGVPLVSFEPNVVGDPEFRFGSLCAREESVRCDAIDWYRENIALAKKTGVRVIVNYMGDGSNYPGEDDFRERKHRLLDSYGRICDELDDGMRLLLEYKPFEPRYYHTDLCDWGAANMYCQKLGSRAKVIVDTGHHLQGANVEHIVSLLLDEKRLGGFHFNSKKYADDDLLVGAINPYELFLIMCEIVNAQEDGSTAAGAADIMFMIDQNHYYEAKVPTMLKSVINIQTAYTKALLLDRRALADAQERHDTARAEYLMMDAFQTDVRPLIAAVREEMGLAPDPMRAYVESGYEEKIVRERG